MSDYVQMRASVYVCVGERSQTTAFNFPIRPRSVKSRIYREEGRGTEKKREKERVEPGAKRNAMGILEINPSGRVIRIHSMRHREREREKASSRPQ